MLNLLQKIIFLLPAIAATAAGILMARRLLHYFQLESYQFYGYSKTCLRRWKALLPCMILPLVWGGVCFITNRPIAAVIILLSGYLLAKRQANAKEKKPFVITARMKRLYVILGIVLFCFALIHPALIALLPLLVALAALIALPIEKSINRMYMRDAQKKLFANQGLIRIGITGSYGKTSVKVILYTILSQKYNVLSTPASFNTPMGLTRVIRERLEPAHQIFLAEMGARHKKDIKELTDFIQPTIGVLTSVGPQHLDTFKTLENIIHTKYDLIRALPEDGFAVFNGNNAICEDLHSKTMQKPKALIGKKGSDAWAEDISLSAEGSSFTLCLKDGARIPCTTRLLGAHNISNILLACVVGRHLGLSNLQLQRGVSMLQPVEHRLQLLRSAGGVTVIDDAFNSNPSGAKAALDVLAKFPGRRIIVTPGMVELGGDEDKFNREFGREMASAADVCVLIGKKHTRPIQEGLIETGYPQQDIHVFPSLADATQWLNGFMKPGDFILYENDLPDHYSE
ncbi:MAG: UDP-N-acetylmuramoyl-tripeptide--D-alanyl-D-alanine ligase [Clostridia bacterium]|nr:UDP-N-acetylmuramoyl-tripeptide--D-alanyl-D-alanine ligase [Clostridia bacterium]